MSSDSRLEFEELASYVSEDALRPLLDRAEYWRGKTIRRIVNDPELGDVEIDFAEQADRDPSCTVPWYRDRATCHSAYRSHVKH